MAHLGASYYVGGLSAAGIDNAANVIVELGNESGPSVRQVEYSWGMTTATRSRRLEIRLDPATDDLIGQAAAALGESRSAFVTRSMRAASARVLARADVTLMDAGLFAEMVASLDTPGEAPALDSLAAGRRAYEWR
ncbi:MAG: DUF1778 domain-containing protein [Bifidobacteriaceae bacterium]|jgi:uncharacterized protein (DUF1778 family)|nr:DUF1778 domain-containing protein [Bifidobacteriaceae bacterium]